MALRARERRMFPFPRKPSFDVFERLRIESHDLEVGAVVLGMAANAVLARRVRGKYRSVIAAPCADPCGDVFMTFSTLQLCRSRSDLMARDATRRAIPLCVSLG